MPDGGRSVTPKCDYCQQETGHHVACPVLNVKPELVAVLGVATSDWIDMWARRHAITLTAHERDALTETFSLHHKYVERCTEARLRAEIRDELRAEYDTH